MTRRRVALLLIIVVLLVLALCAITYMLSSLLTPPGTQTIEPDRGENGVTMTWVRSIYGFAASGDQTLDDPSEMAVDGDLIYVAQPTRKAVWVFRSDGSGVRAITNDQFVMPNAVEVGPGERLFVADKGRDLVFCIDEEGTPLWMVKAIRVSDMTWAGDRLYIAAFDRIHVVDINGDELFQWGERGYGKGQLDFPHGVLVRDDEIIVSDGNNARLQAFDADGAFLWETGLSYRDPASEETSETRLFQLAGGLADAPDDRILVVDPLNFDIAALDAKGSLIGRVGSEGSADGKFWYPSAISPLGGDLYVVADTLNDRLQVVEITFDDGGGLVSGGGSGFSSLFSNAWYICPTALVILMIVAAVAWVMSGRRDDKRAEEESALEGDDGDADIIIGDE